MVINSLKKDHTETLGRPFYLHLIPSAVESIENVFAHCASMFRFIIPTVVPLNTTLLENLHPKNALLIVVSNIGAVKYQYKYISTRHIHAHIHA